MKSHQQTRTLGPLEVGSLALGCMGMSGFYGPTDDEESTRTIHEALERGVRLFDTADRYGLGKNEELVGRALSGRTDALVATKFGIVPGSAPGTRDLDGSPAYVARACEASLRRLGRDVIDLYYLHRVDPKTPIEETVGAMARLVEQGKVRAIGLSEASAATLRRAHAVHPIAALQSEYSVWCREAEESVLPACKELGVGFVAYAPLGLGFLTGRFASTNDFGPGDYRPSTPRFSEENFAKNRALVDRLVALAKEKGCSPAQLALAWVIAEAGHREHVVALFGTKRREHLRDDLGARELGLNVEELERIETLAPVGAASGQRYAADAMRWVNG